MKRWMRAILGTALAVICMVVISVSAFAVEKPEVSVPVTVSLSGTLPSKAEEFTIILKADDVSFPMPDGAVDGVYTMTITGADTKNLPTIIYNRVGIYTYTIYQVAGSNKKCTYDNTVYALTVYITNAEDGSGLEATAVLYPDSEGEKLYGAEFKNVYETTGEPEEPETPTPGIPDTSDGSMPILYAALIAVSVGVIVTLFLTRKTKKMEE